MSEFVIAKDGKWFYAYFRESAFQRKYHRATVGYGNPEQTLDMLIQYDFRHICRAEHISATDIPNDIHRWDYVEDWFSLT